jgi:hypothetical protein
MKKIQFISLMLLVATLILSGCQAPKETAREILEKSFAQSANHTSATTEMTLTGNLQLSEGVVATAPESQAVVDMINGGSIFAKLASDQKTGAMNGEITVGTNGMSFAFNVFMRDFRELIVKTPLFPEYITMDLELPEDFMSNQDQLTALNDEISKVFLNAIKEDSLAVEYKVDYEGKDGKTKLNVVTVTMTHETLMTFLREVVPAVYESEAIRSIMMESALAAYEGVEDAPTEEELNDMIAQTLEQFPAMLDSMEEVIKFDQVVIKLGVDDKYATRTLVMDLNLTATDQGEEIKLAVKLDTAYYAFNQTVTPTDIEITDDNSMSFEELMWMMLMGGFNLGL